MHLVIARVLLGVVFLAAGITKLPHLRQFRTTVSNFEILPASLVSPATWLLPTAETLLGLLLVWTPPNVLTTWSAICLLGSFTAAVALNLLRGRRHFSCGCFGGGRPIDWWLVGRNAGFVCIALALRDGASGGVYLEVAVLLLGGATGRSLFGPRPASVINRVEGAPAEGS